MLTLLLSKDWVAGRDAVLQRIARDVREEKGGRVLLVPELISHDMERRLCAAAGDTASRFAEVLSFTRLARRVADSVGSAARECLDAGGRVVAMAAAARQLHSKLKAYASLQTKPEFLEGLVDAVDEFKRCCITAEDLKAASDQSEGAFAQKLEELSLLLDAYNGLCARGKMDPRDQMTWLLEKLADCDFGEKHTFYIDGFPDFTRQNMAIVMYLIRVSPNVVISLNCDRPGSTDAAFEKAGETALQLLRFAQQEGIAVEILSPQPEETPFDYLRRNLFQGSISCQSQLRSRLHVLRCDSIHGECEAAAARVLELVHSGCRYRDIGIVCTDVAGYENTLSLIFNRCGIPLYRSGTEDILQKTVITTVLSAMDAALGGFDRQDVLRYLKSVLSPITLADCDLLENYTFLWAIQGSRWLRTWENHPDGLSGEWNEEARLQLAHLNTLREQVMAPLVNLRRAFLAADRLAGQVEALCAFFEEIGLAQRLSELADSMDAAGDNRSAQILNQLWEILLGALEQLHGILGETVWDNETFTRLFTLLLSQYDVGTIPAVLDSVTAGPVSAMRCQQVQHLILLGAQEGLLPSYSGSSGVLTDQERDALRQMGVPLTGGGMEGLQAEFSEIYGVFCGARESITVTCCDQSSFIYHRLSIMAGGEKEASALLSGSDVLDAAALLAAAGAKEEANRLGIFDAYKAVAAKRAYRFGAVDRNTIPKLYGRKLRLSASQVDQQAQCRLAYFLKYGLRAKERREATVDPAEFGTYVHAVLEHTAKEVMFLGGFHQVSLEKTMEIAMAYSDVYTAERFSQLDSQRLSYLFQRNIQELAMVVQELWQELSASEFAPVAFELAFGDDGDLAAIDIPNPAMPAMLRGFVDRVDRWSNGATDYFRVVDYKTGRKDFDYCDVFNGIGLQMLLYLFALEEHGKDLLGDNAKSAGVQYFPARSPYIATNGSLDPEAAEAERAKGFKRKGLVLSDSDVLAAMEPENAPKRLSIKVSKDGSITGDIADREQMNQLRAYVFTVLSRLVGQIASGDVTPNPYSRGFASDACTYCPYHGVCRSAGEDLRRNYKTMTAQRFWEEIGKELKSHG